MKKTTLLSLLVFMCFILNATAQCTFGTLNPSQAYTPVYDGNEYIIHSNSHPGEYMRVNTLSTATIYKFESSVETDYITITDADGAQVFASGLSGSNGISFTPPYPQVIRFYLHEDASCATNPFSPRWRKLTTTTVTYPCDSPSNLSISNITSNSARVSWDAPVIGTNFSYEVYANTTGVAPTANTNPNVEAPVDTEAQLDGLNPNSTYYYWVRTECVSNAGIWVPGGSFMTNTTSSSACNGAPYGLYPEETFTLVCNGAVEQIVNNAYAGEYTNVFVSSGQQYTFISSVSTDFITITDPTGETVYTAGQTPLVWINNSNWGTIRYYLHTNANCGTEATDRIKSIKCGGDVIGGCTNGDLYPATTFTPSCTGSLELIANNSWAGEYANINVTANKDYTFSTSTNTDYITIVNPTGNVVLATGQGPLTWNSGATTGVIRYYLHTNANCGTQDVNRQRYIQCSTSVSCGVPTALAVANITSSLCQITWTAPATVPNSGYEIYIATTNVAPVTNTTPTLTSTSASVSVTNGLTASTTYYYWVRSNCGTAKSSWVAGGSFTTTAFTGCNTALYGQWPAANFTPACSGATEQIVVNAYASEFTNVNIVANRQYTFSSSVLTDFITITNDANVILASGTTPLSWPSQSTSGVIRYYLHTNASCGAQNTDRIKYIQCVAPVSCGLPTNLAVSNITSNSCRLFWNAPTPAANSYDLYLSTNSTAPTAATNATQTSNANLIATLNGLSASTTYYYWVRSNCNGTRSAWVAGGSFTTVAFLTCNGAFYGLYPEATFTPACSGNTEQIVANAWAGEFTNVTILSDKQYTFTSSIGTDFITITNATGTTVLASGVTPLVWNSNATSGLIRYHLNTNANCVAQNTDRVRSIKCVSASSCNAPTQFGSEVLSPTSAVIGWIPSTSAPNGGYLYVYNTTPTIGGIDGTTGSTNADLTDLLPNTTYYWWVASNCVTSQSDWAFGGSFTTPSASSCWQTVSAGTTHSVGIKTDGTLWAWGDNGYGQLGDGTTVTKNVPTQIGASADWQKVSANGGFSVGIKTNGTLWVWGNNSYGQLGDGTTTNKILPTQIGNATNWVSADAGEGFILAVKANGTLWAWGNNNSGQLGDGTTLNKSVPTQIGTATNWQSVAAGSGFSLAIKTNGTLWAWGHNNSGQLGDGTTTNRTTPVQIGTENDWSTVAAGYAHSVGLKMNGILFTWGNNANGQLGDGTNTNKLTPTGVYDQVESIEAGWYYTVGTTTFGNMWASGQNNFGQLGDGTTTERNWISVSNSNNHQLISAGAYHTFSLYTDGSLGATGLNGQGRLGDGTTINRIAFTPIACPTNNLGINDFTETNTLKVYPNPVSDILTISSEQGISSVTIYNLLGQEVITKSINANETAIDVSTLTAGSYLVKVASSETVKTIKVIKK